MGGEAHAAELRLIDVLSAPRLRAPVVEEQPPSRSLPPITKGDARPLERRRRAQVCTRAYTRSSSSAEEPSRCHVERRAANAAAAATGNAAAEACTAHACGSKGAPCTSTIAIAIATRTARTTTHGRATREASHIAHTTWRQVEAGW